MENTRILFSETHFRDQEGNIRTSAVDWWRTICPYNYLKSKGWDVELRKGAILPEYEQEPAEVGWGEVGENFDIMLSSYQDSPIGYSYSQATANEYGLKTVLDVDDDVFDIAPYNPVAIEYTKDPKKYRDLLTIIKHNEYLTCTNRNLKDKLVDHRGKKGVSVVPNLIDPEVYKKPEKAQKNGLVIGYMGGTTHIGDVLYKNPEFYGALSYILGKYQGVSLELLGFTPGTEYEEFPNAKRIPGKSDFYEYVELLRERTAHWDIALAPLEETNFNKSKSPIKWMEYTLMGVPVIAQNFGPYKIIRDGKTGLLASKVSMWLEALELLINSESKRKQLVAEAERDVLRNHNIWTQGHKWEEYVKTI